MAPSMTLRGVPLRAPLMGATESDRPWDIGLNPCSAVALLHGLCLFSGIFLKFEVSCDTKNIINTLLPLNRFFVVTWLGG